MVSKSHFFLTPKIYYYLFYFKTCRLQHQLMMTPVASHNQIVCGTLDLQKGFTTHGRNAVVVIKTCNQTMM